MKPRVFGIWGQTCQPGDAPHDAREDNRDPQLVGVDPIS